MGEDKLMQKVFFAGIGLATEAKKAAQKKIDELIKAKKITKEQGKMLTEEISKTIEDKTKNFEKDIKDFLNKTIENFTFVKKSDFDKLVERVEKLEKEIEQLKK